MTARSPAAPEPAATGAADWRVRPFLAWIAAAAALTLAAVAAFATTSHRTLADLFLFVQDLPVLVLATLVLAAIRFGLFARAGWGARAVTLLGRRPGRVALGCGAAAAVVAVSGWFTMLHGYGLSMDEFMAGFDAAIFRRGALAAPLSPEWRPFAFALQPQFVMGGPHDAYWVSSYLPMNAAVRAAFGLLGADWLANALWAALGVAATFGVARRLWPDRPDAAAVAAVLLASSSQFLLTAMTPYAASAHLALNMAWLWLFLRDNRRADGGAALVGLLATGLHQVVFHPLFVAPFVLHLWLQRRWGRAAFFTAAYGAIGLFWLSYWRLALPGAAAVGIGGGGAAAGIAAQLMALLGKLEPQAAGVMAKNLLRFIAWQNPLAPALALAAAAAAVRRETALRALLAGMGLTIALAGLLMPFQGHGWGYRYLHGFLGALALTAAYGWMRLTEGLDDEGRRGAGAAFVLAAAFSMIGLLPLRAAQASAMVAPYARAARAIDAKDADVVLIDPTGLFYAADLVRNDPWLERRPKRMDLGVMTDAQIAAVCSRYKVTLFDRVDGAAAGIEANPGGPTPRMRAQRALLTRLGCGR